MLSLPGIALTRRAAFLILLLALPVPVQVCAEAPAAGLSGVGGAPAESKMRLPGHTAPQVIDGSALRLSHYDPSQKLRLTFSLQPPHVADEELFLQQLQTKGSANFHKFLSATEWNARYAPATEDEQKVLDWAQSQGFTVTGRFSNRLLVNVEASAATIESALGVTINSYQMGISSGFANDRDPLLPASLVGIVTSIQGLNNLQHEHGATTGANNLKPPDYAEGPLGSAGISGHGDADWNRESSVQAVESRATANLTNGAMDPTDLYSSQAYDYAGLQALGHCCNPNNKLTGSPPEASIAIAAFGPFSPGDIVGFNIAYPYLAYQYSVYNINGTFKCPVGTTTCPSEETTQDLEWAIATSNSFGSHTTTAHIYVYIGATTDNGTFTTMYNRILSDGFARVFTTSWSCTELLSCSSATMDARHAIFNAMVGQGWTLIAASGDRGAADDCNLDVPANSSVSYPASDPDFVATGGTELAIDAIGNWLSESGWQGGTAPGSCADNNGGSGGGASAYYAQPWWQSKLSGLGSTRLVPDLALNASGIGQRLYFNGSMTGNANGTSLVAPELAGFFAQENAYLLSLGKICGSSGNTSCAPIGNPTPLLYDTVVSGSVMHNPFYDITSGCNSNDATTANSLAFYCAGAGYDLVTGWGSANMMQLAWALNSQVVPAQGNPTVSFTGPSINTWYNTDQTVNFAVNDSSPGSGIAGLTEGWDSIPADPASEASGGSGNSFYSGPANPNMASGCLNLAGGGCSAGVTQGCHMAHVEAWNNLGNTTGDTTYGPLCLDTISPTVAVSGNPSANVQGWNNTPVTVTLTALDPSPTSGIANTYYSLGVQCTSAALLGCTVFTAPFTVTTEGTTTVASYAQDNAGNFGAIATQKILIDMTPPTTTASITGTSVNGVYNSAVKITLQATDNLSKVQSSYYQLDGGSQIAYNATVNPPAAIPVAALGRHTMNYWSVDYSENVETANTLTFSIASPTTTTLSASPSPAILGQSVNLKAMVAATLSGTPTGQVTFFNGTSSMGSAPLVAGIATLATTTLPSGQLTLQASYPGGANFLSSNSPTISLSVGTASLSLSTGTLAFPQTQTGTSVSLPLTLTNTGAVNETLTAIAILGANAANFSANGCLNVPIVPNANCTMTVRFSPATAANLSATLSLTDNATDSPQTVALSGKGVLPPALGLSATALNFPQTLLQKSSTVLLTLTNTGGAPLTVSGIVITSNSASVFGYGSACVGIPIALGGSCTMPVTFSPASAGSFSGSLAIADNASPSPQIVKLIGTGISQPMVSLSRTTIAFLPTYLGKSVTLPVTMTNAGTNTLKVTSISTSGSNPGEFSHSSTCVGGSFAPGASCTINVKFTPASALSYTATLKINDNAPNTPQTILVAGTGAHPPTVKLSSSTLSFASTKVGATSTMFLNVTNSGLGTLVITGITNVGTHAGYFAEASNCVGLTIQPQSTCTMQVGFTPMAKGSFSSTMKIVDNATNSPQSVTLNGSGK